MPLVPRAEALPGRRPARGLEQAARLDGDRRAGGGARCAAPVACVAARAVGRGKRIPRKPEVRRAIAHRERDGRGCVGGGRNRRRRAGDVSNATATKPWKCGVFGAPTYLLNGERFWGQDRLDFLDRALDARLRRVGCCGEIAPHAPDPALRSFARLRPCAAARPRRSRHRTGSADRPHRPQRHRQVEPAARHPGHRKSR